LINSLRSGRHAALLALALLTACAVWKAVPESRLAMGDLYTVQTGNPWNARREGSRVYWTIDGEGLQEVIFFNGIRDGEALFAEGWFTSQTEREKRHRFGAGMDYFALSELVTNSWSGANWQAVEARGLRPAPFGPYEGFRLDLSMRSPAGLDYQGLAAGTVQKGRLYLVVYTAARIHSYQTHLPDVEELLQSIRPI
jgi:hypothetical protein